MLTGMGLTARQKHLLRIITAWNDSAGEMPTYSELKIAMRAASNSCLNHLIRALIERGFLQHVPRRSRGLRLIRRLPAKAKQGVRYFRFDDDTKTLVEWQP